MTNKVYGYCRISRKEQSIERQKRNISSAYPDAVLVEEAFTGTKLEGREKFANLLKRVKPGDTIVFDSVSRMSRNAEEGIALYDKLYDAGVKLVFLKESTINTETYKGAIEQAVPMTGNEAVDAILEGVNKAMRILRHQQIEQAFAQAQKEVDDLHQRTREGMMTARLNGKQIGTPVDAHFQTKVGKSVKSMIILHAKEFGGSLEDPDVIKLAGCARNTYYKYKKEIREEKVRKAIEADRALLATKIGATK